MPPVNKKSVLGAKYGSDANLASQIAQDTSLPSAGFQDPPPGIKNGKAQLDEIKFDVFKAGDNEGQPYCLMTGVILEPVEHTYTPTSKGKTIEGAQPVTVKTAGMQTRIMIGIHDIKIKSGPKMGSIKTYQEAAKEVAAHFRALGADTSKVRVLPDLEDLAESLTRFARDPNTPIYFGFSTSVRKAQNEGETDSGCWQNWHGTQGLEDYSPPDGSAAVADNSGDAPDDNQSSPQEDNSGDSDNPLAGETLEALLEAAKLEDGDDTPAQDELLRRASEMSGRTVEDLAENLSEWEEAVAIAEGKDPAAAEPEPEAPSWKKGDHCNYYPTTKGVGGRMVKAKKPVECGITAVNDKNGTVTLKNTVDGKTLYKDVPFAELEEIK